ncbi:hypothetical protein Tco_1561993 [Tanacetum coccineum]
MAYWGFFGVGTTLDIFQNIILIPYLEYGVLILSGYGVLILFLCGLWSVQARIRRIFLDGYDVLVFRTTLFDVINTAYPLPSDTAYPTFVPYNVFVQKINTAYSLPLDTAYRSSGTESESKLSSTNELLTPYKEPEREFRSSRRHFKTLSLDELRSPDFNLFSDQEYSEEEEAEEMAETMEQYMSKTRTDYGSGVARPKIEEKDSFELKGQFLKELRENTFSSSDNKDANDHIEKRVFPVDQLMLRIFPISLTGAASHWLRNKPTGSIKT